ncbi:MAG TPA: HDOD domain-containing protein [Gemmatimonadaceae bacterium]|nr:HDOD domain-containing protein [Gemmatimonadaceae bacterium]
MSGRLEDDPELLHACDQLVWSGYRFAFECDRPGGLPEGFVRLAEIVRIDVSGTDESRLSNVAAWLREYHVRLLAAQVRHRGERDVCAHLGFELFEGHRFNAPETPARYDMPIDHARTFRLLRMVRDDRTPDSEIEELLRRDGALSYKLLSMVHFTATGRRDVRSIGHALHLVGRHQVGRWLALLLVSHGAADGLRAELVTLSLVRARMCELLADAAGIPQARGDLFLVGLLSTLGLLLEMPMEAVCDSMELDVETRVALESRGGVYGAALGLVEAYERADWDEVEARASALGLRAESLGPAYLDALAGAGAPAERLASLGGLARGTA